MQPIITTERLHMRRFEMQDLGVAATLYSQPEVMKYIRDGSPWSRAFTEEQLQRMIDEERRLGFGNWALIHTVSGTFLGECGLSEWDIEGTREIEVGYLLSPEAWGKGYATEAVRAVRDYSFTTLKLPRLIALIHPENEGSARVARKAGFTYEGDVPFWGKQVYCYALMRDAWAAFDTRTPS
jgi:ribosomal-protein-alanine N-acetyltransferase